MTIEIVLRHERYSRDPLPQRVLDWVKRLAQLPRTKEGAEIFKVKAFSAETARFELFDLLKDQLVTSRQVVKQSERLRGVNSASMYEAIESAYTDLRASLEAAAGIET